MWLKFLPKSELQRSNFLCTSAKHSLVPAPLATFLHPPLSWPSLRCPAVSLSAGGDNAKDNDDDNDGNDYNDVDDEGAGRRRRFTTWTIVTWPGRLKKPLVYDSFNDLFREMLRRHHRSFSVLFGTRQGKNLLGTFTVFPDTMFKKVNTQPSANLVLKVGWILQGLFISS